MKKIKQFLAIFALIFILTLCLVEGISSMALFGYRFVRDLGKQDGLPIQIYLELDPLLGWRPIPGKIINDLYGPGTVVSAGSQAFRGTDWINPKPPKAVDRLICSGDSFTFGYGVGDSDTWCAMLQQDHRQAVNLGVTGYGLDQEYLRYKRDAEPIQHNIHIIALITDSFR